MARNYTAPSTESEEQRLTAEEKMAGLLILISERKKEKKAKYSSDLSAWEKILQAAAEKISDDPTKAAETILARQQISEAAGNCNALRTKLHEKVYACDDTQAALDLAEEVEKEAIARNVESLEEICRLKRHLFFLETAMLKRAQETANLLREWDRDGAPNLPALDTWSRDTRIGIDPGLYRRLSDGEKMDDIRYTETAIAGMRRYLAAD